MDKSYKRYYVTLNGQNIERKLTNYKLKENFLCQNGRDIFSSFPLSMIELPYSGRCLVIEIVYRNELLEQIEKLKQLIVLLENLNSLIGNVDFNIEELKSIQEQIHHLKVEIREYDNNTLGI